FELTLDEWHACAAHGGCPSKFVWAGWIWERGRNPITDPWDNAKKYVAWIAKLTGKPYRLLSEAEWEYAARAGTQTAYSWGDEIGKGNASCAGCGGKGEGDYAGRLTFFADARN